MNRGGGGITDQIISTFAMPPHRLGPAPEYDDAYVLAMVESMGLDPLTCGIPEVESLAGTRVKEAMQRQWDAHDRYMASLAAERLARPWWRRMFAA